MIETPAKRKSSLDKETEIKITGDGSCAFYPVAVTLCAAVLANKAPFNRDTAINYQPFLNRFAEFHHNFTPVTWKNFRQWVKTYATTKRDMELLVGPVLRHWYSCDKGGLTKDASLAALVKERGEHLDNEAMRYICERLGLNLKCTDNGVSWDEIENLPAPTVHVVHTTEHFDLRLNARLAKYVKQGDSQILARNSEDVNKAWNHAFAPLDAPVRMPRSAAAPVPAAPAAAVTPLFSDFLYAQRLAEIEQKDRALAESLAKQEEGDLGIANELSRTEVSDVELAARLREEEARRQKQIEADHVFAKRLGRD
jgi:hypothetical protein